MIDMQAIRQDVLEVFQEHKTVKGIWDIGNDFKLYIKE